MWAVKPKTTISKFQVVPLLRFLGISVTTEKCFYSVRGLFQSSREADLKKLEELQQQADQSSRQGEDLTMKLTDESDRSAFLENERACHLEVVIVDKSVIALFILPTFWLIAEQVRMPDLRL